MLAEADVKRQGHGTSRGVRPLNVTVFPIERQCMTEIYAPPNWTLRRAVAWAVVPMIGFALAFWLRYGVIQPEAIGLLCAQADAPGWCRPREWLILGQYYEVWGWVAVAAAAIALVATLPPAVLRVVLGIALLFSALALVLYNTTLGALALVVTLLALLRRR
jgi:hypothetical protein